MKPLVGNKDIERQPEVLFQTSKLPFRTMPADEVIRKIGEPHVETHFSQIYDSLVNSNCDKY